MLMQITCIIYANHQAKKKKKTRKLYVAKCLPLQASDKNHCNSSQPSQSLHSVMYFPSLPFPGPEEVTKHSTTPNAKISPHIGCLLTNNTELKVPLGNLF